MRRLLSACLLVLLLLPTAAMAAPRVQLPLTDDPALRIPQDERIYYIVVDRFLNGDPANDGAVDRTNPTARHGGDLRGVISKLDYIKELGFTAIMLTPIFASAEGDYLGYEAVDLRTVDPHFGDLALAKKLVEEAHARKIKVLFDLPVRPEAQSDFTSTSLFWIEETGVDGFRLHGAEAVAPDFWRGYATELRQRLPHLWLLADMAPGSTDVDAYQEAGLAVLDHPFQQAATATYARRDDAQAIRDASLSGLTQWSDPTNLGGFLDGPEQARFATLAGEESASLMLALIHLYTHTSVPIVYYGTEIGMTGEGAPANQADFPWDSYMYRNPNIYMLTKSLNRIRGEHLALRRGTWEELLTAPSQFAFARELGRDRVVVVLNTSSTERFTTPVPVAGKVDLPDGTRLFDKLSGKRMKVTNGAIPLDLEPGTAAILTVEETAAGIYFTVAIGLTFLAIAAVIIVGRRRMAE